MPDPAEFVEDCAMPLSAQAAAASWQGHLLDALQER